MGVGISDATRPGCPRAAARGAVPQRHGRAAAILPLGGRPRPRRRLRSSVTPGPNRPRASFPAAKTDTYDSTSACQEPAQVGNLAVGGQRGRPASAVPGDCRSPPLGTVTIRQLRLPVHPRRGGPHLGSARAQRGGWRVRAFTFLMPPPGEDPRAENSRHKSAASAPCPRRRRPFKRRARRLRVSCTTAYRKSPRERRLVPRTAANQPQAVQSMPAHQVTGAAVAKTGHPEIAPLTSPRVAAPSRPSRTGGACAPLFFFCRPRRSVSRSRTLFVTTRIAPLITPQQGPTCNVADVNRPPGGTSWNLYVVGAGDRRRWPRDDQRTARPRAGPRSRYGRWAAGVEPARPAGSNASGPIPASHSPSPLTAESGRPPQATARPKVHVGPRRVT